MTTPLITRLEEAAEGSRDSLEYIRDEAGRGLKTHPGQASLVLIQERADAIIAALRQPVVPVGVSVDALAQEIRRVDGRHTLGAGALAEALLPFLAALRPTDTGANHD